MKWREKQLTFAILHPRRGSLQEPLVIIVLIFTTIIILSVLRITVLGQIAVLGRSIVLGIAVLGIIVLGRRRIVLGIAALGIIDLGVRICRGAIVPGKGIVERIRHF